MPAEFEVFFFSRGEPYADRHFARLRETAPGARRIENVSPSAAAWAAAARLSRGTHFFSVDADNWMDPGFSWAVPGLAANDPRVHVWRCRNPVNGLVYGHGAVKLWSREKVLLDAAEGTYRGPDYTARMSRFGFLVQPECASETRFNESGPLTWAAAFRETLKLATGSTVYSSAPIDPLRLSRLLVWATLGRDAAYGAYSLLGARMALRFSLAERAGGSPALRQLEPERMLSLQESLGEISPRLTAETAALAASGLMLPEVSAAESAERKARGDCLPWASAFEPNISRAFSPA